jgi:uncharacterized protein (TIGR02001 family)
MFDLPPPDPGVEISIASRGMSKGIAQTEGPQLIGRAHLNFGDVQVAGQWKNVTSSVAQGEAAASATWQRKFGRIQTSFGATFKFQTGVSGPTDDKALELNGSVAPKWGKFGLRASVVYSPNDFGSTRQSIYAESGASYDLGTAVRVSANAGRRQRQRSQDYTSFNAGITVTWKKLTLDARYFDTAHGEYGEIYKKRLVVIGRLSL